MSIYTWVIFISLQLYKKCSSFYDCKHFLYQFILYCTTVPLKSKKEFFNY